MSTLLLHDERHVLLVRELGPLPEPEAVVDGERVYGHRQVLRVDLGELLASGVVSEKKVVTLEDSHEIKFVVRGRT